MACSCGHELTKSYYIVDRELRQSTYEPDQDGAEHCCDDYKCRIRTMQHLYGPEFTTILAQNDMTWLMQVIADNASQKFRRLRLHVDGAGRFRYCTIRGETVDDISYVKMTSLPFFCRGWKEDNKRSLRDYNKDVLNLNLVASMDDTIAVHWKLKGKLVFTATYNPSMLDRAMEGSCSIMDENGIKNPVKEFPVSLGLLHCLNTNGVLFGKLSITAVEQVEEQAEPIPSVPSTIVLPDEHWAPPARRSIGSTLFIPVCQCLDKQITAVVPNTPENCAQTLPVLRQCDGVLNWKLVKMDLSGITLGMHLSQEEVKEVFFNIKKQYQDEIANHIKSSKKRIYLIFRFIVSDLMEYIVRLGVFAEPFSVTVRTRENIKDIWLSKKHFTEPNFALSLLLIPETHRKTRKQDYYPKTKEHVYYPNTRACMCSVSCAFRSVRKLRLVPHTHPIQKSVVQAIVPMEVAKTDAATDETDDMDQADDMEEDASAKSEDGYEKAAEHTEVDDGKGTFMALLRRNGTIVFPDFQERHKVVESIAIDAELGRLRRGMIEREHKEDFVRVGKILLEKKEISSLLFGSDSLPDGDYYEHWLLYFMCMLYKTLRPDENLYTLVHSVHNVNVQLIFNEDALAMLEDGTCSVNGCLFIFIGGVRVLRNLFRRYRSVDDILAAYDMKPGSPRHIKTMEMFLRFVNIVHTCEEQLQQLFVCFPDVFSYSAAGVYAMLCQQLELLVNKTQGFYIDQWKPIHKMVQHMTKVCSLVMDIQNGAPVYGESTSGKTTMFNQLYVLQSWLYRPQEIGVTPFFKDGLKGLRPLLQYQGPCQQLKQDIHTFSFKLSQRQARELDSLSKDMGTEREGNTYSATSLKMSGFLSIQNYLDSTTKFPTVFTSSIPPWTYQVVLRPSDKISQMAENDEKLRKYIASSEDIQKILFKRVNRCLPIVCLEHHPVLHRLSMETSDITSRMLVMMSMIHGVRFDVDDETLTLRLPFPQVIEEVRIGAVSIGLHDIQGSRDACQHTQVPTQPFEDSPVAVIMTSHERSLAETAFFIYTTMHVVKQAIQQFAESRIMSDHPFSILLVCNVQKEVDVLYKGFSAYNNNITGRHAEARDKWCETLIDKLIYYAKEEDVADVWPEFDVECKNYLLKNGCIVPVVACLGATTTLCHLLEKSILTADRITALANTWHLSGLAEMLDFIHRRQPFIRAMQWRGVMEDNKRLIGELIKEQQDLVPLKLVPKDLIVLSRRLNAKPLATFARKTFKEMSKDQEFSLKSDIDQNIFETLQDLFSQCHLENVQMVPPNWSFLTTRSSKNLPQGKQVSLVLGLLLNGYDSNTFWQPENRLVYMRCIEKRMKLLSDWAELILELDEYVAYLKKLDECTLAICSHIASRIFSIVPRLNSPHQEQQIHAVSKHIMLKYITRGLGIEEKGHGNLTDKNVVFSLVQKCFESSKETVLKGLFTQRTLSIDFSKDLLGVICQIFKVIFDETIQAMKNALITKLPTYTTGMMDAIKGDILGANNSVHLAEDVLIGAKQGLEIFNATINSSVLRQFDLHDRCWVRSELKVLRDKILFCRLQEQLEPLEPEINENHPVSTPIQGFGQLLQILPQRQVTITIHGNRTVCEATFPVLETGLWKTLSRLLNVESVEDGKAKMSLFSTIMPIIKTRGDIVSDLTRTPSAFSSAFFNLHILGECLEYYILIQVSGMIVGKIGYSGSTGFTIQFAESERTAVDEKWKTTPKGYKRDREPEAESESTTEEIQL